MIYIINLMHLLSTLRLPSSVTHTCNSYLDEPTEGEEAMHESQISINSLISSPRRALPYNTDQASTPIPTILSPGPKVRGYNNNNNNNNNYTIDLFSRSNIADRYNFIRGHR